MQDFLFPCFQYRQVVDSAMFLCLKMNYHCESHTGSPELSAGCGSPEWHVPYIIQNQYLTSCSPRSVALWWLFENIERLQFESLRGARAVPTAAFLPPSSSIFLPFFLHTALASFIFVKAFLVHVGSLGLRVAFC